MAAIQLFYLRNFFAKERGGESLQLTNFHVCLLQTNEGEVPAIFSGHSQTSPKLLSVQYISELLLGIFHIFMQLSGSQTVAWANEEKQI